MHRKGCGEERKGSFGHQHTGSNCRAAISKAGNHAHQLGGVDVAGSVPIGCGKTTDYGGCHDSAGIPIPGRITKGAGLGRFIAPRESSIAEYAKVRSGKWCEGIQIVSSWAGGQSLMFPSSGWPFFRNLGGREAWPEKGALGRPVPPCACATAREHWRGVKGNAGGRTSCHNPTADQL